MPDNKAVVQRFLEAISERDQYALAELIGDDVVDHHLPPGFEGKPGMLRWLDQTAAAFSDMTLEILRQSAEGALVATHMRLRAKHTGELAGIPATGAEIEVQGMVFDRIADGKIVERWEVVDRVAMMQQLQAAAQAAAARNE